MTKKLLALLTRDPRLPAKTIASVLGMTEAKTESEIKKLLKNGEIVGFKTIVNTNKHTDDEVTAMVEVRVATVRGKGFDEVAQHISRFPEVLNVYLISGSHDLNLLVKGKTLQDVAGFVTNKLSVIDGVCGTATHFLLKKYKEDGLVFDSVIADKRLRVSA